MAASVIGRAARNLPLLRDCGGTVAAETAMVAGVLGILTAQVLDYGWYTYCSLQVKMAAHAAAAEAAVLCDTEDELPATINCDPDLKDKMEAAANEVSIGGTITITEPDEGYFCHDPSANNALVEMGDASNKPANCEPHSSTEEPADFVFITASYDFSPMFPGLSAISYADGTITADGWMRVDWSSA